MTNKKIIISVIAPVHKEATFTSEMVTQCLMWEFVDIINKVNNWYNVKTDDGYIGWIYHNFLNEYIAVSDNSIILHNRINYIYNNVSKDSKVISVLSFGTIVPIIKKTSKYYQIEFLNGEAGYIPEQDVLPENTRSKIIELAKNLEGVPYLWGGKTSFGYDCSGFVQMVFKVAGIKLERDASCQIKNNALKQIDFIESKPGDLIFFMDDSKIVHVGIIIGDGFIIHSYGKITIDSIIKESSRYNQFIGSLNRVYMSIENFVEY
mgnify:CR=1 FL=1